MPVTINPGITFTLGAEETVFNWNGMGRYLLENGIGNNDINVVLGWLMVSAVVIVIFNLIADILYAVLDPRIRLA